MNKTCIITGASQGLGRCLAERFAAEQFDIAICARRAADLERLAFEFRRQYPKIRVFWQATDMNDKEAIQAFIQAAIAQHGSTLNVLINNVGAFEMGHITDEADGILERMMSLNLYAAYYSVKAALPTLMAQKFGHIFNIGSIASVELLADCGAYSISKHALHTYTQLLRRDLASHGVRVTSILPGAMFTRSWEGATVPPEKIMPPQDVAEMVWQCYEISDRTVIENMLLKPLI